MCTNGIIKNVILCVRLFPTKRYDTHPYNYVSLILLSYTIPCRNIQVFIHSTVKGHLDVSSLELLKIILLCTFLYISLNPHVIISFGLYLGIELIGYKVCILSI